MAQPVDRLHARVAGDVSAVRKGDLLVIRGDLCTIVDISVSKADKRGREHIYFMGLTATGAKREVLMRQNEYGAYRDATYAKLADA